VFVDLQHDEGGFGGGGVETASVAHGGEVAGTLEQAVGDAWRPARAAGDDGGGRIVEFGPEDGGTALDDGGELLRPVRLQVVGGAEAVAQRGSE
jgi:hypothetical protein